MQIDGSTVRRLTIVSSAVYIALLLIFCIVYRVIPGLEFYVIFIGIYALSRGRTQRFVRDWTPFTLLFVGYEAMYGIADKITGIVHVSELINVELRIFGTIPTLVLQEFYRSPTLDYIGTFLYSLHFLLPVGFGLALWRYSPGNFAKFTASFLLCTYSALITFLIFPTAPPWYGVNAVRIISHTSNALGVPGYRTISDIFTANQFAAFPSLHSAFPLLISLYAIKIRRLRALPILMLPIGVWFSAVYLGEHYVVDVVGGIAYSACAYLAVEKLVPRVYLSLHKSRGRDAVRYVPEKEASLS